MVLKYRPDIDGLRALAVLPVVLFHAGVPGFLGGYVGVDIFFVISGFVIAKSLKGDIDAGQYSILKFYERRIRRILPAFVATILVSAVFVAIYFLPSAVMDFGRSVVAASTFLSNVYFWKNSGYFEVAATTRPLLHTWSLSVEEQYYVFIPVVLYLCSRYAPRAVFAIMAVTAVLSLGLSIFATRVAPTANFFLLPTRAWELLLGALIAYAAPPVAVRRPVLEALALAGLAAIAYSVLRYDEGTPFPGAAALLPTVGAALIIWAGQVPGLSVSQGLGWRPLVFVGLISYSLYLVHWPIMVFVRYATLRNPDAGLQAGIVLGSLVLAYLSWRFVEQPFRKPVPGGRGRVFAGALASLAGLVVLGGAGIASGGLPGRFPDFDARMAALHSHDGNISWKQDVCFLQGQPETAWKPDECMRVSGKADTVILWGDSFAAHYVPGLVRNAAQMQVNVVQYTYAGCPPDLTYDSYARPFCRTFNQNILAEVDRFHAKAVILSARWDQLRQRGLSGIAPTIAALERKNVKVYVIGQSPTFLFDVAELAFRGAGEEPGGRSQWNIAFDPAMNADIARIAGPERFIDPLAVLCRGVTCPYRDQGMLLFDDYGHFSQTGSARAVLAYFPYVAR